MNREQRISEMDGQTDRKLLPTHAGQFLGDASQPARSFPQIDRFDAPTPLRAIKITHTLQSNTGSYKIRIWT